VWHGADPIREALLQGLDFFLAQGGWLSVESDQAYDARNLQHVQAVINRDSNENVAREKRQLDSHPSVFSSDVRFHKAVGKIQSIAVRIVP